MANPKKKRSPSKQGRIRAHKKLTAPNASLCPQCQEPRLPHRVCPHCGTYKGVEYITPAEA
jgi:large subunit ribosomal protein L32